MGTKRHKAMYERSEWKMMKIKWDIPTPLYQLSGFTNLGEKRLPPHFDSAINIKKMSHSRTMDD